MNRSQKLAALAKVLQASDSETALSHLEQVRANQPKPRLIVDDFGLSDEVVINATTPVWFMHEGKKHRIPLGSVARWLQEHIVTDRWLILHPEI